jgi:hypothetical protein
VNELGLDRLVFAESWLRAELDAGETFASSLLGMPTGQWRGRMRRDANLRRYGTLSHLLDAIHNQLYYYP